ncbi:hypothetical protein [Streptomyces sp. NPDC057686]|uniref:hypothetical protein n=1 Tax=Streptomyces sp. NPDC057686 TaxID=3346212 RepID=UPI003697132F
MNAWAEDVIARYLTVGGATVDLAIARHPHHLDGAIVGERNSTRAACTGCDAAEEFPHHRVHRGVCAQWEKHEPQAADEEARGWARSHAETTCRTRPTEV